MTDIILLPLASCDRDQFVLDNQEAFNYGALEEFGRRDDHFEEDGEIISRKTIEAAIDAGEAYRIMQDGQAVGGAVIKVEGDHGDLELLFVSPSRKENLRSVHHCNGSEASYLLRYSTRRWRLEAASCGGRGRSLF